MCGIASSSIAKYDSSDMIKEDRILLHDQRDGIMRNLERPQKGQIWPMGLKKFLHFFGGISILRRDVTYYLAAKCPYARVTYVPNFLGGVLANHPSYYRLLICHQIFVKSLQMQGKPYSSSSRPSSDILYIFNLMKFDAMKKLQ